MRSDESPRLVHQPVMTAEVVAHLEPRPDGRYLDCTVGAAGHARALLEAGAGRVLGLDRDPEVLPFARATLASWSDRVELVHADFREIGRVLDERGIAAVDGAVADLGMSSMQLEAEGRGFSFQRTEPLDMRMDRSQGPTAADLLRDVPERALADLIFEYGGRAVLPSDRTCDRHRETTRSGADYDPARCGGPAGRPEKGSPAYRPRDPNVSSTTHLGQRGARPAGSVSPVRLSTPSGGCASCRHFVSLT